MGQTLKRTSDMLSSVKTELQSLFRQTWRQKYTHDKMLELRKAIYEKDYYKLLPRWAQAEVSGFFGALYECEINRRILWTHVFEGKRVLCHAPCLDGKHGELDAKLSYHCYGVVIDGEFKLIPFRRKDRVAELDEEKPRITEEDLRKIDRRMMPENDVKDVYLAHKPNGTPYPVVFTEVIGMPL